MLKPSNKPQENNKNEVFTYVAVPLDSLQSANNGQNVEPVSLILKTMPDGSFCIIDTNNFLNSQSISMENESAPVDSSKHVDKNARKTTKKSKSGRTTKKNTNKRSKETTTFTCNLCTTTYTRVSEYRTHMREHTNRRKFRCEECSACFNVENNLKLHMAIHSKGTLTCPMCSRNFQRIASLKSHLMIHQVDEFFSCPECMQEFEKEDEWERHMDAHKKEQIIAESDANIPLICSYCNYLFEDPDKYKEHVSYHIKVQKVMFNKKRTKRTIGNRDYIHKCAICKKSFPKMSLLERHMRIHSGEKPYICNICNRGFSQSGTLQIHIMSRHEGRKPYECSLCPAKFNQKGNLRVHHEKTHTAPVPGEKVYKCNLCTCIYKRVATLNGHIAKAHATEATRELDDISDIMAQLKALEKQTNATKPEPRVPLVVEKRQEAAEEKSDSERVSEGEGGSISYVKLADSSIDGIIRRYLVKQRKVEEVRWYLCNYCPKEFKKPSDLIRHIRVHTREKPFKCSQCCQSFSLKSTLMSHLNTHIGAREYKCAVCLKMFTSVRTLNVHLRKHERQKSLESTDQYKCTTCNKIFTSLSTAKSHMETHKSSSNQELLVLKQPILETVNGLLPVAAPKPRLPLAEMEQYRNRPYRCSECNAVFKKMVHLKRHSLIHSGDKRYKCIYCPKSFYTAYALKDHANIHSGVKNYACKVCNKRFVTNSVLKRHLITHTSHKPYICPYCKKRFKTVLLCRKHIKVHKKDGSAFKGPQAEASEPQTKDPVETVQVQVENQVINVPLEMLLTDTKGTEANALSNLAENVMETDVNALTQPQSTSVQIGASFVNSEPENAAVPAIFITYEDLQALNPSLFQNAGLPQIKLQLNAPQQTETLFVNDTLDATNIFPIADLPTTEVPNLFLNNLGVTYEPTEKPKTNATSDTFLLTVDDPNLKFITEANAALPEELNAISLTGGELGLHPTIVDPLVFPAVGGADGLEGKSVEVFCVVCREEFLNAEELKGHKCGAAKEEGIGGDVVNELKESGTRVVKVGDEDEDGKDSKAQNDCETQFECGTCKKVFSSRSAYFKHYAVHKHKKTINGCSYCGKVFKKPSDLARHVRTHTGEKPFKCDKCDKSFSLKSTLESHFRTHNPVTNKEFNCNVCNSYFSSKASLKVHMMLHTDSKPYECRFCTAKFRTSGHRKFHESIHARGGTKSGSKKAGVVASVALSATDEPQEEILVPDALTDPTTVHIVNDQPDALTQTIQIDPLLLQHLQENGYLVPQPGDSPSIIQLDLDTTNFVLSDKTPELTEPKPRPFECEVCQKKFGSRDVLTKHMKRHGKEAFRCTKCKVGFDNEAQLETHKKVHAGYRPYSCPLCTNSFGEEGSLKTHMRRIHQVVKESVDLNLLF